MPQTQAALVWFRRDLRDFDHAALYHALKNHTQVYCVFVFDKTILDVLTDRADRRVEFIWHSVNELKLALQARGSDLIVVHEHASHAIPQLANTLHISAVYCNRDYEPAAIARDKSVAQSLTQAGIAWHSYKDQVLFEQDEVLSQTGNPYSVFTPYKNAHIKKLNDFYLKPYAVEHHLAHLAHTPTTPMPTLASLNFSSRPSDSPHLPTGMSGGKTLWADFCQRMQRYQEARDFPAIKGVSYLSVHLRFGTVSIRHLAHTALEIGGIGAQTWLNELIWRDFYFQILHHHPRLAKGEAFKPEYNTLHFPNDPELFSAWCEGRTGYPLVDAAMRQLNQTGYMHNRLRMLSASFLVKDLLIDWRWGEAYFAQKLLDFDFAANNGGWQWAASTGCDAQPYFRIFNPVSQSEKFDAQGKFIRKYVPELSACQNKEIHAPWLIPALRLQLLDIKLGVDYPYPVVDHASQREQALRLYKNLQKNHNDLSQLPLIHS